MFKIGQRIFHKDWGFGTVEKVNLVTLNVYFDKYKESALVLKNECEDAKFSPKDLLIIFGISAFLGMSVWFLYWMSVHQ